MVALVGVFHRTHLPCPVLCRKDIYLSFRSSEIQTTGNSSRYSRQIIVKKVGINMGMVKGEAKFQKGHPKSYEGKLKDINLIDFGNALIEYMSGLINKEEFAKKCGISYPTLKKYEDELCEMLYTAMSNQEIGVINQDGGVDPVSTKPKQE